MEIAISCAWLAAVTWLIARALRQRDLLRPIDQVPPPLPDSAAPVAVIIPARNEEANIRRCLLGLLGQSYPPESLHVLVIDDHSTDATAALAASLAKAYPALTVLQSPPLPAGWTGKSHACWNGTRAAPADAEWLCFVDADVWAGSALLASATTAAAADCLDLLSLAPQQQLDSFAERLVMPCGLYLLGFCQDLRELQSRHSDKATATGQFMLVRRAAYEKVGGHAAVKGAICEDVALARLVKRAGGNVLRRDGSRLVSTRMYTGWASLWIGVSKNLVDMLGGPMLTIATALLAVTLAWAAWLIPLLDAWRCAGGAGAVCWALAPGLIGSAAAFALHVAGASHFGIPLWYGLIFPLGYTAGAFMAIDSVCRRWRGRVSWKGRTYP